MSVNDLKPEDRCDELDFTARIRFFAEPWKSDPDAKRPDATGETPDAIEGKPGDVPGRKPDGAEEKNENVIESEYVEIEVRRKKARLEVPPGERGRPLAITGLALSGGGVRSATFNLGLLQALAAADKLKAFDYLSTVSGGGYTGGWWSAWLSRNERKGDEIFPPEEDIDSERDNRRWEMENKTRRVGADRPQIKDSAINASEDPIHHLRLFSNVMTPRKGILSADTWRAVAVIGRNISLTWMALVPILLAAIMIGQAWYTLAARDVDDPLERLNLAIRLPAFLFIGSCVCVTFWMFFSRRLKTLGDAFVVLSSTFAFFALTGFLIRILGIRIPGAVYATLLFWIAGVIFVLLFWKFERRARWDDYEFWRNRLVVLQTRTLTYSVFTLVISMFGAFGYSIFDFLLNETHHAVTRAGGWGAFALAAATSIYTALKAAPTGGADSRKPAEKPPLMQRIVFAVAPLLLLLAIGVVLSWIGNMLYRSVAQEPELVKMATRGGILSASLFLAFALYEFRPPQKWKGLFVIAVWAVIAVAVFVIDPVWLNKRHFVSIGVVTLGLLAAALVFRALLRKKLWIAGYAVALMATAYWLNKYVNGRTFSFIDLYLPQFVIAGVVATLVLLIFELIQGRGANSRSIALTVIACTMFVIIGAAACSGENYGPPTLTLAALISTILGWVMALGWLADPNSLTMHEFYKARLVRAYMGASNAKRTKAGSSDITDAVPGDDILLTQLRNTERGAPYHLINTMLNLVGGSDLSTQARSSDSFLMSKLFCGSMRTGFRKTSEYSCGSISLGTAVSVSGAAASPSMGAQTPSAALSALMTLFNVRTGYWAPTPSLSYWRSGSARLWPVYTLQELVSQTTDLLPFCYLTDGGHYENTGVYSLIQRGCNLIVAGECGADPQTTLEDLGNLIRKVRIDFGTEIKLDIDKLRNEPRVHFIIGTILYGADHATALNLPDAERTGTIVVVKPNLCGDEAVDVRQYGFQHQGDFPQQNTFDLWYDEAQFESYRKLGQESGKLAIEALEKRLANTAAVPVEA
jgi:hypothetical protein